MLKAFFPTATAKLLLHTKCNSSKLPSKQKMQSLNQIFDNSLKIPPIIKMSILLKKSYYTITAYVLYLKQNYSHKKPHDEKLQQRCDSFCTFLVG